MQIKCLCAVLRGSLGFWMPCYRGVSSPVGWVRIFVLCCTGLDLCDSPSIPGHTSCPEMACENGSTCKRDVGKGSFAEEPMWCKGKRRRKALRVLRGSLLWHKLSWKSLSMSQSPSRGQQLAGTLVSPLWDGAHPSSLQNSWGNNKQNCRNLPVVSVESTAIKTLIN